MAIQHIINFFSGVLVNYLAEIPFFRKCARFINIHFSPDEDIMVKVKKHRMYANTVDRILALYLWKLSALENFEIKLMEKIIKKGMIVFDIGANIGYHTLIFANLVGKNGKVYAFEPDPSNYRLLVKNIKVNGYKNVVAVQKAISNESETLDFYLSQEHRGDHRLYDTGDGRKAIKVEATTIDKFTKGKINPNIAKIDIQGAEFLAMQGMIGVIKRNKGLIILCEFSPNYLKKGGYSPKNFLQFLKQQGFKLKFINEKKETIELINPSSLIKMCQNNKYVNLFLKRSS